MKAKPTTTYPLSSISMKIFLWLGLFIISNQLLSASISSSSSTTTVVSAFAFGSRLRAKVRGGSSSGTTTTQIQDEKEKDSILIDEDKNKEKKKLSKRKSRRFKVLSDERVVFFPTAAHRGEDNASWEVPIHGWIYEPEFRDPSRRYVNSFFFYRGCNDEFFFYVVLEVCWGNLLTKQFYSFCCWLQCYCNQYS